MKELNFKRDVRNGITISILAFIGWLVFLIVHTFLWSSNYTFFQNIIIAFISFLIVGALVALMWMTGAKKYGNAMKDVFKEEPKSHIESCVSVL